MPYQQVHAGTSRLRSAARLAALASSGGVLFQLTGCASGLAPVLVSFAESAALSYLLGLLV
jgi:hypothetical protein